MNRLFQQRRQFEKIASPNDKCSFYGPSRTFLYSNLMVLIIVMAHVFLTGCNRDAVIFASPPKGKLAATIVSISSTGIDSDALNAIEYAFFDFSGVSITKYNEVSGKLTAVRIEGSVKDYQKFRAVLTSLKKDKQLFGLKIFFLDENSSNRIEL